MGQRQRRDRVGHQQRAKGKPTPARPEDPQSAGAKQLDEQRDGTIVEWAPPPSYIEIFAANVKAAVSRPDGAPVDFLDVTYRSIEGLEVVVRIPLDAAGPVVATIAAAVQQHMGVDEAAPAGQPGEQRTEGGIIVPGHNQDLAAEAKVAADLKGDQPA